MRGGQDSATAKNRGTAPTLSLLPTGAAGGGSLACSAVPCLVGVSAKYAAVIAASC